MSRNREYFFGHVLQHRCTRIIQGQPMRATLWSFLNCAADALPQWKLAVKWWHMEQHNSYIYLLLNLASHSATSCTSSSDLPICWIFEVRHQVIPCYQANRMCLNITKRFLRYRALSSLGTDQCRALSAWPFIVGTFVSFRRVHFATVPENIAHSRNISKFKRKTVFIGYQTNDYLRCAFFNN